jgi:hypothetical protein
MRYRSKNWNKLRKEIKMNKEMNLQLTVFVLSGIISLLLNACRIDFQSQAIPEEYKNYIPKNSVPVSYKEIIPFHGGNKLKIPAFITKEQAMEDIDMFEYLFSTSYAGYEYWESKGINFKSFFDEMRNYISDKDTISTYDFEHELSKIFRQIFDGHIALIGDIYNWAYRHKAVYYCDVLVEKSKDGLLKVIDTRNDSVKVGDLFTQNDAADYLFKTLSAAGKEHFFIGKISPDNVSSVKLSFNNREIEIPFHKSRLMYSRFDDPKPFYINRIKDIPVLRITSSADNLYPEMKKFTEAGKELKNEKILIINLFYNGGGSSEFPQTFMRNLNGNSDWEINWAMLTSPAITEYFYKYDLSSMPAVSPRFRNWIEANANKFENYRSNSVKDWEFGSANERSKSGNYEGTLIFLTNRRILSAGEGMIGASQSVKNRIIIGENTGGVAQFSDICEYYLPNSKFIAKLPRQFLIIPGLEECVGYLPDYWLDTNEPLEEVMTWLQNRDNYQFKYSERFSEMLEKNNFSPVLPNDVKVVTPGSNVSKDFKSFSGKWSGVADGILDNMLVVEKINNDMEADVVYSWGVAYQWGVGQPGWQRYKAKFQNKTLTIIDEKQKVKITYTLNPDNTLISTYERPGSISRTILTKLEK